MSAFVLCINNQSNAASLILGKVYQVLPDADAARHYLIRINYEDTSEPEGYLYPASHWSRWTCPMWPHRPCWPLEPPDNQRYHTS